MLGHVFSYNILRRKIYPTLLRPRTFVHYSVSMISSRPARLPNRRDHGSLSQNRPRLSVSSLWLYKKKHFYTWCAGLIVHSLLTRYIPSWLVFSTELVNCCPHGRRNYTCVLLPLDLLSDLPQNKNDQQRRHLEIDVFKVPSSMSPAISVYIYSRLPYVPSDVIYFWLASQAVKQGNLVY